LKYFGGVLFLGIDVGTGGTRAILIDERGAVVSQATEDHIPFATPRPGFAEQDPDDWWRAATIAIRRSLADVPDAASRVAAIGLTGQMHGAVMLDEKERPIRPAPIWCDLRSTEEARAMNERAGALRIASIAGNPALPHFTSTKVAWLHDHEPQNYARLRHLLCPKDYVRLRLSGTHAMDVHEASGTLLLDLEARTWSNELADLARVDPKWLPRLFESPHVSAEVSAHAASETGLRRGTPIAAGAGDQGAGAVGLGIVKPGAMSATIGSSGVVFAATDKPLRDPKGRVQAFCHAVPGRWHLMGVTQAAGLSLRWLRDLLADAGVSFDYERLASFAAKAPSGSAGLIWAPYLQGERTPHLDPNVRASFVGLSIEHRLPHLARAVMEGVAFSLQDGIRVLEEAGVPITGVRLGGGGARSSLWRQIQADAFARPVEITVAEEGAAFGAALLAAVSVKVFADVDAACAQCVRVASIQSPDPASSSVLAASYRKYRNLYPALHQIESAS
jgi:xylulokinase